MEPITTEDEEEIGSLGIYESVKEIFFVLLFYLFMALCVKPLVDNICPLECFTKSPPSRFCWNSNEIYFEV